MYNFGVLKQILYCWTWIQKGSFCLLVEQLVVRRRGEPSRIASRLHGHVCVCGIYMSIISWVKGDGAGTGAVNERGAKHRTCSQSRSSVSAIVTLSVFWIKHKTYLRLHSDILNILCINYYIHTCSFRRKSLFIVHNVHIFFRLLNPLLAFKSI